MSVRSTAVCGVGLTVMRPTSFLSQNVTRQNASCAGSGGAMLCSQRRAPRLTTTRPAWTAQLATYLLRLDREDGDARRLKADALRLTAQSVTSANVRSWCMTQARELEGLVSLERFRNHHPSARRVLGAAPEVYVHALKVQLDPDRADFEVGVQWYFSDTRTDASLRIRRGVAIPGKK